MFTSLLVGVLLTLSVESRPSRLDETLLGEVSKPQLFGRSLNEHGGFSLPAFRRDASNTIQKRSAIAATNNNWWLTIGLGTPPQDINFLPDSGAWDFVVQSTLLPPSNRADEILYDPSKSSTAKQLAGYTYSEGYGSGYSDSGVVYNETVTFGTLSFSNVPLLVMNKSSSVTPHDRSGNIGLSPTTSMDTSPKRLPSFMQSIRSSISKGVATFNYNRYTLTGEMDVGFIDTNKYVGSLVYVPNAANSYYWQVQIDGMVVNNTFQNIPFSALIDTGTGGASIPRAALDAYFSQVPAAYYDSGFGTYLFPCNTTLPDMTFSVGGLALRIPKQSWIGTPIGNSNTCGCSILPGNGFLGEIFVEGAFIVFDYDNLRVGFANKPADSTTITAGSQAGSTYFCTGTGFTGTCQNLPWKPDVCNSLQNTPFYHNVSAFGPDHGGCTLYSDSACANSISSFQNVHYPGTTNAGTDGKKVGSYVCFYPNDYPPQGTGNFTLCPGVNFLGACETFTWNSYSCQVLPTELRNNVMSAKPSNGYCYTYTDQSCTIPVQGTAPFAASGKARTPFGAQIQSYMCV